MKRQEVALAAGLVLLMLVGVGLAEAQTASVSSTTASGAMLYANGNVKVNGQAAGISTSIFAGDTVEVGDASSVSINRSGSSIVLSPNSSVRYEPTNLDVLSGTVRVSTTQGMGVHAGNVSVTPQEKASAAKYDVTASAGGVSVASQEGALSLNDGGGDVSLSSGSRTTLGAAAPEEPKLAKENFLDGQLAQHPFYGTVAGINPPQRLPVCRDTAECIRPRVSQIAPCCCPPRIKCD